MKIFKKILVLALTVALTVQTLVLPTFAATGDGEVVQNYNAIIMDAKGGADAIATLTFDDGRDASVSRLVPLLERYGLKASLMLVPYRIDGNAGAGYSNTNQLLQYAANGVVDLQAHGYSHMYIAPEGTADFVEGNFNEYNVQHETEGALLDLNKKFPDQDVLTFAVPGNSYRTEAMDAVMKYYYAARRGLKGNNTVWQTLNPADNYENGGWYNPYTTWLSIKGSEAALQEKLDYLSTCVTNKGWFIAGAHDIVDNPTGSNDDMSAADAEAFFAKLKEYQDAGRLWVATYSEATKYIRERQNSTVSEYATADGLFVKVSMKDKTENGLPLDINVFDMPLTVRVEIPEGWQTVRIRQLRGSEMHESYVDTVTSGGKTFAFVDVLPNGVAGWLTDGNAELPKTELSKEDAFVASAKGGANAIVSMTFDDGLYDTAVLLNELFAEYGLKGSLMMTGTLGGKSIAEWDTVFRQGYLEPQSHSMHHAQESQMTEWTDADWTQEIGGSKTFLEGNFPSYDCLTYAVPYSAYSEAKLSMVGDYFYAIRSGLDPLSYESAAGKVQSLDPAIPGVGTNKYNTAGGWYNTYTVRMQPNVNESMAITNGPDQIIAYLSGMANKTADNAKDGGWFISITHAVVPDDAPSANPTDPNASRSDMTESQARQIFSAMQSLQEQGKVWVTTFSEATKYVRERQNATVSAYTTADGMFVDLKMADVTADGLPLAPEIFNVPLTVKIKVPNTWGKLTYSQGGLSREVECFSEGGLKFAYIDLVPNGGAASIINTGDPTGYVESLGMKQNVSAENSLTLNLYLPKDNLVSGVYIGRTELAGATFGEDMVVYSVGSINVKDIYSNYNVTLKFNENTGFSDYVFSMSVMSYFEALANNASVTAKEKQLAFDFLVFARATVVKFAASSNPDVARLDAVITKLTSDGCTASVGNASPQDLGTLPNVLKAADMAINEKPYFLFYVKEGFTGKLTVSYTDAYGTHSTEFEIINGYYHCKDYVIFEVSGVYSLASELTITATGKIGDADVSASGKYSMKNYADGVNSEYVNGLYSWVLAAAAYMN